MARIHINASGAKTIFQRRVDRVVAGIHPGIEETAAHELRERNCGLGQREFVRQLLRKQAAPRELACRNAIIKVDPMPQRLPPSELFLQHLGSDSRV
jgi:hypothetical protein